MPFSPFSCSSIAFIKKKRVSLLPSFSLLTLLALKGPKRLEQLVPPLKKVLVSIWDFWNLEMLFQLWLLIKNSLNSSLTATQN
jgi:hypothetical protein